MTEQLISFETAKLAKEKGFEFTQRIITDSPYPIESNGSYYDEHGITQSLLQKWLREIHDLDIEPEKYRHDKTGRYYKVRIWGKEMSNEGYLTGFKSYEEALEAGLLESLELI